MSVLRVVLWRPVPFLSLLWLGALPASGRPSPLAAQTPITHGLMPGVDGVLSGFAHAPIVAIPDRHRDSEFSDFRIRVIRHPQFSKVARDVVIEWGGSFHQATLDRYVAGEDVPTSELRRVWRDAA